MIYHERALDNYFIPCHRRKIQMSDLRNQCDIRAKLVQFLNSPLWGWVDKGEFRNWTRAKHDAKAGCNLGM